MRAETSPFVAFAHFDGVADMDEGFQRIQFADARLLQEVNEGGGAAVHSGDFRRVQFDSEVVDAEACEGGHEVLDGSDAHAVFVGKCGAELGIAHEFGVGREFDNGVKVGTAEADAAIGRRGQQADVHPSAAVYADAGARNGLADAALSGHQWVRRRRILLRLKPPLSLSLR